MNESSLYARHCAASDCLEEYNDCSVRAVAAVSALPYRDAHWLLARMGRKRCEGLEPKWIHAGLHEVGLQTRSVPTEGKTAPAWARKKTMRTLMRSVPKSGSYLIYSFDHVAAVVDGVMHDFAADQLRRVVCIYSIHETETRSHR